MLFYSSCELLSNTFLPKKNNNNKIKTGGTPTKINFNEYLIGSNRSGNFKKMATAMERKFTGVRKRLDQLGYRQPLGVESLPLVERLLADLLHTSESLKNSKLQIAKNKEQKGN